MADELIEIEVNKSLSFYANSPGTKRSRESRDLYDERLEANADYARFFDYLEREIEADGMRGCSSNLMTLFKDWIKSSGNDSKNISSPYDKTIVGDLLQAIESEHKKAADFERELRKLLANFNTNHGLERVGEGSLSSAVAPIKDALEQFNTQVDNHQMTVVKELLKGCLDTLVHVSPVEVNLSDSSCSSNIADDAGSGGEGDDSVHITGQRKAADCLLAFVALLNAVKATDAARKSELMSEYSTNGETPPIKLRTIVINSLEAFLLSHVNQLIGESIAEQLKAIVHNILLVGDHYVPTEDLTYLLAASLALLRRLLLPVYRSEPIVSALWRGTRLEVDTLESLFTAFLPFWTFNCGSVKVISLVDAIEDFCEAAFRWEGRKKQQTENESSSDRGKVSPVLVTATLTALLRLLNRLQPAGGVQKFLEENYPQLKKSADKKTGYRLFKNLWSKIASLLEKLEKKVMVLDVEEEKEEWEKDDQQQAKLLEKLLLELYLLFENWNELTSIQSIDGDNSVDFGETAERLLAFLATTLGKRIWAHFALVDRAIAEKMAAEGSSGDQQHSSGGLMMALLSSLNLERSSKTTKKDRKGEVVERGAADSSASGCGARAGTSTVSTFAASTSVSSTGANAGTSSSDSSSRGVFLRPFDASIDDLFPSSTATSSTSAAATKTHSQCKKSSFSGFPELELLVPPTQNLSTLPGFFRLPDTLPLPEYLFPPFSSSVRQQPPQPPPPSMTAAEYASHYASIKKQTDKLTYIAPSSFTATLSTASLSKSAVSTSAGLSSSSAPQMPQLVMAGSSHCIRSNLQNTFKPPSTAASTSSGGGGKQPQDKGAGFKVLTYDPYGRRQSICTQTSAPNMNAIAKPCSKDFCQNYFSSRTSICSRKNQLHSAAGSTTGKGVRGSCDGKWTVQYPGYTGQYGGQQPPTTSTTTITTVADHKQAKKNQQKQSAGLQYRMKWNSDAGGLGTSNNKRSREVVEHMINRAGKESEAKKKKAKKNYRRGEIFYSLRALNALDALGDNNFEDGDDPFIVHSPVEMIDLESSDEEEEAGKGKGKARNASAQNIETFAIDEEEEVLIDCTSTTSNPIPQPRSPVVEVSTMTTAAAVAPNVLESSFANKNSSSLKSSMKTVRFAVPEAEEGGDAANSFLVPVNNEDAVSAVAAADDAGDDHADSLNKQIVQQLMELQMKMQSYEQKIAQMRKKIEKIKGDQ